MCAGSTSILTWFVFGTMKADAARCYAAAPPRLTTGRCNIGSNGATIRPAAALPAAALPAELALTRALRRLFEALHGCSWSAVPGLPP